MSSFIYKHYDQVALNHQYNNRELVPHYQQYFDLWPVLNREVLDQFTFLRDIPYGDGLNEKLDIYPAQRKGGPTMIFIHGGYWQMMDRADFRFIAKAFVPHDIHTVIIGYPLAPAVTISRIIQSVRKALTWIHHQINAYGGDPDHLYLSGHSAGGHLASLMITREYAPDDIKLRGVTALSGLYDLVPIQLSHVNIPIGMSKQEAIDCSPLHYTPNSTPLTLAVGADESDEYHAQLHSLVDVWSTSNDAIQSVILPGVNHFSILSELLDSQSTLYSLLFNRSR